jgi:hypothetical protein
MRTIVRSILNITFICISGFTIQSFGQTENVFTNMPNDQDVINAINSLKKYPTPADYQGFLHILEHASEHRKQMIDTLLGIFGNTNAIPNKRYFAAQYLGIMHANQAVNILASNIEVMPPVSWNENQIPDCGIHPVSDALVNIGSIAIPALINNLAVSDSNNFRAYSLECLLQIEGNDKDIVSLRLRKAIDNVSDPIKKARLQSALVLVMTR